MALGLQYSSILAVRELVSKYFTVGEADDAKNTFKDIHRQGIGDYAGRLAIGRSDD
jgi:hypothetical protein